MAIEFEVSTVIPAEPQVVYHAWLDSAQHGAMTGGEAQVSDQVGATFTAWDGYISGKNLELDPGRRILQSWRTVEFAEYEADSLVEVTLTPYGKHTRLILRHSNLPEHGSIYEQGWIDNYFEPMLQYFAG
jgi:uncharacterized protein YndB with AHSA1/START domain